MFYVDGAHAFAIVVAAIIVLDGARWRDALPEVIVLCRRDAIFLKTLASGVDETTFVFYMCIWWRRDVRWKMQFVEKVCFT